MRTIIIGDIHGCNQELLALLGKVGIEGYNNVIPSEVEGSLTTLFFETRNRPLSHPDDRLILLGDLFDRGPESREVFQTVQSLAEQFVDRFTLLRGNHEDYLMREKLSFHDRWVWDRVGRGTTVKSFKEHGERMEDAAPWLREHCRLFVRGEGFQCVHAGLMVDPIEANDNQTLVHDHCIVLMNSYQGPFTVVGHIALDQPTWFAGDGETTEEIPYEEERPLPDRGILCIDTGCGKGGHLTAMICENGRYMLFQ